MDDLRDALERNGLDASTLDLLLDTGSEQIYQLIVPGTEAVERWGQLREIVAQTGYWPVLIGDRSALERHIEIIEAGDQAPAESILAVGLEIDADAWLAEKGSSLAEYENAHAGKWPEDATPRSGFTIPTNIMTGDMLDDVYVALIPTTEPWAAPAYLRFGGIDDCPLPAEHVAVLKRWYEKYGSEVVGMSADVVELRVARPPMDREAALALAHEQYDYCLDIVEQGGQSVAALAASLLGGTSWYFWWA